MSKTLYRELKHADEFNKMQVLDQKYFCNRCVALLDFIVLKMAFRALVDSHIGASFRCKWSNLSS